MDLLYQQLQVLIQRASNAAPPSPTPDGVQATSAAQFACKQAQRASQAELCDFLLLLRTVAGSRAVQGRLVSRVWLDQLLGVVADAGLLCGLRVKMLSLQLLRIVLPACSLGADSQLMTSVSQTAITS